MTYFKFKANYDPKNEWINYFFHSYDSTLDHFRKRFSNDFGIIENGITILNPSGPLRVPLCLVVFLVTVTSKLELRTFLVQIIISSKKERQKQRALHNQQYLFLKLSHNSTKRAIYNVEIFFLRIVRCLHVGSRK